MKRLAAALGLASMLGCATVLHGPSQTVEITSNPPGARVAILPDGVEWVTPAEVELSRRWVRTLVIEREGYRPTTIYLDRDLSEVSSLLGAGPGLDHTTGAMYRLFPASIHVELAPIETTAQTPR